MKKSIVIIAALLFALFSMAQTSGLHIPSDKPIRPKDLPKAWVHPEVFCLQLFFDDGDSAYREADLDLLDSAYMCAFDRENPRLYTMTIEAYGNSEFGESCAGMSFPVDEGGILAVGQTIPLYVKIKNSKFAEINSPIVITVDPDEKSTCMRVDAADLIQIFLPKKMYTAYKQLDDGKSISNIGPKVHDVLLSMVVVPALVDVLSLFGELKDEPRDVSAFSSTQWYAPVNEQVAAYAKEKLHKNVDLQTLNFLEISKLELAQHLAESPLLRGFDKLMSIGAD